MTSTHLPLRGTTNSLCPFVSHLYVNIASHLTKHLPTCLLNLSVCSQFVYIYGCVQVHLSIY